MRLDTAIVVPGTETPAGDGITGAVRCVLVLPDGSRRAAVLKRGPLGQITAEAFSALLLRAWGLTVPDPYLIDENGSIAFGSADVGYPNLKQALRVSTLPEAASQVAAVRRAVEIVCGLPSTGLAAACDEAIDNRDRNLGNILWDGDTEAWIDHAYALGQGAHLKDVNKLCLMVMQTPWEEQVKAAAVGQALTLDRSAPMTAEAILGSSPIGAAPLAAQVAARLTFLGNRLLNRFPTSDDLLAKANA